jgi:methylated-DNA-[protein]-cysteine S-methyltransferase
MPVEHRSGRANVEGMDTLETPLGTLWLAAGEEGLEQVSFRELPETRSPSRVLDEIRAQLSAYFAGELDRFDVPLAPTGTEFQRRVWQEVGRIPYGGTSTYSAVAAAVGRPAACRAVGAANGRNPLPIVVPCHRVIGAAGSLTGYGGGLDRKRALLDLERAGG